jgi:hypothetical protein
MLFISFWLASIKADMRQFLRHADLSIYVLKINPHALDCNSVHADAHWKVQLLRQCNAENGNLAAKAATQYNLYI